MVSVFCKTSALRKDVQINPLSHLSWASKSIATQSVLNPLLWLCGICIPCSVIAAIFVAYPLNWILALLLFSPASVAMLAYVGLLFVAPDRLHSEKHQMELRKMNLLGDNRNSGTLLDYEATTNSMIVARSDHE